MSKIEPGRIRAENVGRHFSIAAQGGRSLKATLLRREQAKPRTFWAVRHVDLDIAPGEAFGIVGRNGSGKSTLLKMLARIFGPSEGSCEVGGRMSSLLELGAGFHPEFSAIENIYLSAAIYGIPRDEVRRDVESIIDFAELEEFKDQPVKTFSSGMFARLGFSVAMHIKPDVLLLDEVLAVGDEAFVQKCMRRIGDYRRNGGTMVLVSHNPGAIRQLCDGALLLERGVPVASGTSGEVIDAYHERLAHRGQGVTGRSGGNVRHTEAFDLEVRILDANGEPRTEFVEGEDVVVEATFRAHVAVPEIRVGFGIRDAQGREYGDRSVQGIPVERGDSFTVRLELHDHPLRDGQFTVDVGILDVLSNESLLHEVNLTHFVLYGNAPESYGAIQLRSRMTWEAGT